MNLRDIKKDIEYVLGAFLEDCYVVASTNDKLSPDTVSDFMDEAVELYNEYRDKVNAKVEKAERKAYYNNLRKDLLVATDALYEKLSAALKEAIK